MWFLGFAFLVYLLVLSVFLFSILSIKPSSGLTKNAIKKFSIIVAFRNEESNLPNLISSFKSIRYPTDYFEIIFIDDHSSDASRQIVQDFVDSTFQVRLLAVQEGKTGKKAALQIGIENAQYEYIVTTDADCFVSQGWLAAYNNKLIEEKYDAVIGSVGIVKSSNFLSRFQYYDLLALQAVGFALANLKKPILCNGANFCYKKSAFIHVKGFQGNNHQPSGDDVLLLQKFVQEKMKISYLLEQDNVVLTAAVNDLTTFIQQRKRWFYKTKYSVSILQKSLGLLLLGVNLSLLILLVLAFFSSYYFIILIVLLIVKLTIDFFLTFEIAKRMNLPFCFTDFVFANLFYPIGITFFLIYLTNSKIKWKQREYYS